MSDKAAPRHRGLALISAFTIFTGSLAGAAGLAIWTTAPAEAATISQEGIVGYETGAVAEPGTETYVLATDWDRNNYYIQYYDYYRSLNESDEDAREHATYAAQQAVITATNAQSSGGKTTVSRFNLSMVLAGDDISFIGALANGSNALQDYTWSPDVTTPAYQSVPPSNQPFFGFTWGNNNVHSEESMSNLWNDDGVWREGTPDRPIQCAVDMGYPNLVLVKSDTETNYTRLKGLSCQGPLTFAVDYVDAEASPNTMSQYGPFSRFILGLNSTVLADYPNFYLADHTRAQDRGINGSLVAALVAVADNPEDGVNATTSAQFAVLDPQLQVKKEICSTGTNCDVNSDDGWVLDGTFGDEEDNGLESGVQTGVEQGILPSTIGDTLQWRLTAHNVGNVALFDTRVGIDLVTAESDDPADPAPQLVENTCLDARFLHNDSLSPNLLTPLNVMTPLTDNVAILTCTTKFDRNLADWQGTIQNTVALNATMPAGWAVYIDGNPPYNVQYETEGEQLGIAPLLYTPTRSLENGKWYDSEGVVKLPNRTEMDIKYSFIPFNDPNGDPLYERFYGYNQITEVDPATGVITATTGPAIQGVIPSNIDSAQVRIVHPGLKVAKWVCSIPTGCATPASEADLATLGGYNLDDQIAVASQPALGWVKAGTVAYDSTAQWLVVVTNTGDSYLDQLSLTDEAAINLASGQVPVAQYDLSAKLAQALANYTNSLLPPNRSVAVTLSTDHVTATGNAGSSSPTEVDLWKEPVYTPGSDLVNTVTATAVPVRDLDGTPFDPDADPITSNTSQAEVRTAQPEPGLKVTKWVCPSQGDCAVPSADELAQMVGVAADGTVSTGTAPEGSDWVKAATNLAYNTDAKWLVVAGNSGDTYLKITAADAVLGGPGHGPVPPALAPNDLVLAPGAVGAFTGTTTNITNTQLLETSYQTTADAVLEFPLDQAGQAVVNQVQLSGTPVSDSTGDHPLPAPNTVVVLDDNGDPATPWPDITSNRSYAEINTVIPEPGLKVTKWVCNPASTEAVEGVCKQNLTTAELATLSGVSGGGDDPVTVTTGQGLGGWEKQANVDYNTKADWLVVVANIGDTNLINVTLDDPGATGNGHGTTSPVTFAPIDELAPGQAHAYQVITTQSITSTGPTDPDDDGNIDNIYVEPEYAVGARTIVNAATAKGLPADDDGNPLPLPNTNTNADGSYVSSWDPNDPVVSNQSSAEVSSTAPKPDLLLAKWVCDPSFNQGQGCVPADQLGDLIEALRDPNGSGAGGWVPYTTVRYGADAKWLLVATNDDDDLSLVNIQIKTEQVTGDEEQPTVPDNCAPQTALTNANQELGPKQSVVWTCTTKTIYNTNPHGDPIGTGEDVVNTASVTANPVDPNDPDHQPYPAPDGGQGPLVLTSNEDAAEVNAPIPDPALHLEKWVCSRTTTACTTTADDQAKLAVGTPSGGWVKEHIFSKQQYHSTAQWLLVVRNTGNVDLVDVSVLDDKFDGGAPATSCQADARFAPAKLTPGQIGLLRCSTADITNTEWKVNVATAQGTPVDVNEDPVPTPEGPPYDPIPSNPSEAQVKTIEPIPGLGLAKWVCATGTNCPAFTALSPEGQAILANPQSRPNASDTLTGGWVNQAKVKYGTAVDFMVVATNTGETTLSEVKLSRDYFNTDAIAVPQSCSAGTEFVPSSLAIGASGVITCRVSPITFVTNGLTNTAEATGRPPGSPPGDGGEVPPPPPPVTTPPDTSIVETDGPEPALILAKWVCAYGTGCTPYAQLSDQGQRILRNAANVTSANSTVTGGWVNSAKVPYASDVTWLIVATNTGDTRLTDVKLTVESAPGITLPAPCLVGQTFTPSALDNDQAGVISCTVRSFTNISKVTNTAKADGQPSDDEDNPLPPPDGTPPDPDHPFFPRVPSDPDDADVITELPVANLALTKWVCSTGTGCPAFAALPTSGQTVLLNPDNRPADSDQATGGWVKAGWVEYGNAADWLILVTNNGTALMENVSLSMESVANGSANSPTCAKTVFADLLAPTASAGLICTTNNVTNVQAWGSGQDVINTAQAIGRPVLRAGVRLPHPDGGYVADQLSNLDRAEVRTDTPQPNIEIIKYDVLNGDNATTGHRPDSTNPKQLVAEQSTPMRFDIANNGTHELIDVKVTDTTTSGSGVVTNLSCDFSPLGGPATGTTWAGPFLVGDRFTCTGLLEGLAPGQTHQDTATVTATLELTGDTVTDSDKWHGKVPKVPVVTGGTVVAAQSWSAPLALVAMIAIALASAVAMTVRRRTR